MVGAAEGRRTEECIRYRALKSEGRMTADFGNGDDDGQWAPKADADGRMNKLEGDDVFVNDGRYGVVVIVIGSDANTVDVLLLLFLVVVLTVVC